ncbi:MAG: hypothetical protein ACTJLK_02650 [Anaplasma sp.]
MLEVSTVNVLEERVGSDVRMGSDVKSIIRHRPLSNAYFRAGALVAVLSIAASAFTFSYAISAGLSFSWHAPVFIGAVSSTALFLLSVAFMAIMAALQRRSAKRQYASSTVQVPSQHENKEYKIEVCRYGMRPGYSTFQVTLACIITVLFIVSALAFGMMLGRASDPLSWIVRILHVRDAESVAFVTAFSIFLGACTMLFVTRLLSTEHSTDVHTYVVMPGPATGGYVANAKLHLDDDNARREGMVGENAVHSPLNEALGDMSWISGIVERGHTGTGACLECVISSESLEPDVAPVR